MVGIIRDPNFVRDSFWISSLDWMFKATEEPNDSVEFASTNYLLARMGKNLMVVVKLPDNAEDMTAEEVEKFVTDTFDSFDETCPPSIEA